MSGGRIPISKFAEMVAFYKGGNYTVQAIYKRSRKDEKFNSYIDKTSKPWTIKSDALKVFYGIEIEPGEKKVERFNNVENSLKEEESQENQESFNHVIAVLREQLEFQRKELEIKNKQLADLLEIVKGNGQALNRQQALNLVDKREILKIESAENKQKNKNKLFNWFNKRFNI